MRRVLLVGLALLVCVSVVSVAYGGETVRLGVLAKRGVKRAMEQWGPTAEYLSQKIGKPVELVPLNFEAIESAVSKGEIDLLLANSAYYVTLSDRYGIKAIATLINSRQGQGLKEFGGVIFTRADSDIKNLSDLKGKTFMCVNYKSFGGAKMAFRELIEAGIDPRNDFAALLEGHKHDNVVKAVLAGTVDAGTVRTDTIERMAAEGKIDPSQIRVLHATSSGFPFKCSTRLYPEWPMAATKAADPDVVKAVHGALLAMKPDDPAAKAALIVGWVEPLDYSEVLACVKEVAAHGL